MRDPKRIPRILEIVRQLWEKHPDSRFGQMLINCGIAQDNLTTWMFDDWEAELTKLLENE